MTETQTERLTVLTRDHIRFIRTAKHVVFRYVNERSTVEIENDFGAHLKIDAGFHYRGYGSKGINRTCTKAFAMIHTPSFTEDWKTVVSLLRAGDTLECDWLADINTYAQHASYAGDSETPAFDGLHIDQMNLVIVRGKQRLTFSLCLSVCPANSARMFAYAGGYE